MIELFLILAACWCVGFGYWSRDWTTYQSGRQKARALMAAALWPVLVLILVFMNEPEEPEWPGKDEPWSPPPPPKPPERLFPDDW